MKIKIKRKKDQNTLTKAQANEQTITNIECVLRVSGLVVEERIPALGEEQVHLFRYLNRGPQ